MTNHDTDTMPIEKILASMGLKLPPISVPLAAYAPAVHTGSHVYTSGQLPLVNGKLPMTGRVGSQVSAHDAKDLAKVCVLNALAAIQAAISDLGRIRQVVKVVGFVASDPSFTGQPDVVNGASELLVDVFGDLGRACT